MKYKYNVAIIDDEPHVIEGIKGIIESGVFPFQEVHCFQSTEDLILYVTEHKVDIIISDVRMPHINGLEMMKIIKAMLPNVKFIIMSGYRDFQYIKTSLDLGAVNYLVKPVFEEDIVPILNQIINELTESEIVEYLDTDYPYEIISKYLHGNEGNNNELDEVIDKVTFSGNSLMLSFWDGIVGVGSEIIKELFGIDFTEFHVIYEDERSVVCYLPELKRINRYELEKRIKDNFDGYYDIYSVISLKQLKSHYHNIIEKMHKCHHYKSGYLLLEDESVLSLKVKNQAIDNLNKAFLDRQNEDVKENLKQLFRYYDSNQVTINHVFKEIMNIYESCLNPITNNVDASTKLSAFYTVPISLSDMHIEDILDFVESRLASAIDLVNESRVAKSDAFIEEVSDYIKEHISESITIRDLANYFHLHPNYLGQKLKNSWGENFNTRFNRMRINASLELLRTDKSKNLNTIAYEVGYKNYQIYHKYFKMFMNQTPRDYIKEKVKI